jgi:hypothetical protein
LEVSTSFRIIVVPCKVFSGRYRDGSGIVFSYTNPVITVSNLNTTNHIPNNATRYITIASVSPGTPLPFVLMDFQAQCADGQVLVSWKTAPGSREEHFWLARSEDGTRFEPIAKIQGEQADNRVQQYSTADQLAPRQALYYRVYASVLDGGQFSSEIIGLDATDCGGDQVFGLFPNPTHGATVQLAYSMKAETRVTVRFINAMGQVCSQSEMILEQGRHEATLATERLAPGCYTVQVLADSWKAAPLRLVKQ